jgi:replicative DNA helicase
MNEASKDFNWEVLDEFKSVPDRVLNERQLRQALIGTKLTYGVDFLDDSLGGVYPQDLILIGAKSGKGKTQLATIIAMANAKLGKNVYFYALEASDLEIERRIKWSYLIEAVIKNGIYKKFPNVYLSYRNWLDGSLDCYLGEYEAEIDEQLQDLKNLHTFYTKGSFSIDELEKSVRVNHNAMDLIIIDHLHYMDMPGRDTNTEMKDTVKRIRKLSLEFKKPVVLLAQMKKSQSYNPTILPSIDDFHGSSDIFKIATKALTLSASTIPLSTTIPTSTLFRVLKNRDDGSTCDIIGGLVYDFKTLTYSSKYYLAKLTAKEDGLIFMNDPNDPYLPKWAKHYTSNEK